MIMKDWIGGAIGVLILGALAVLWFLLMRWGISASANPFLEFLGWSAVVCVIVAIGLVVIGAMLDNENVQSAALVFVLLGGMATMLIFIGLLNAGEGGGGGPVHVPPIRR